MNVYLVLVVSGKHEDYAEYRVFVAVDKEYAERWCAKFNRIIEGYTDWVCHYYDDKDWSKPRPFWYDYVSIEKPEALVIEVEWR